jgi:hypothetical protein
VPTGVPQFEQNLAPSCRSALQFSHLVILFSSQYQYI